MLVFETRGGKLSGVVDGRELVAEDPQPLGEGEAGVRVWGAALDIHSMQVMRDGKPQPIYDGKDEVNEKALAALGLVLFNLNEFVYVD
jgi:hypothetical protein